MRFQPIYDIAEICARKGIRNAVLSPGSRCAPLTLGFTRHPEIVSRTFSDERSAAFVALGITQATGNNPTVLVCTSGTAVYNYGPAIAEAFFSNTPLIVLTADRPQEWVGQQDGQTIFQQGIFGKHVKMSYQLPQDYEHTDSQWEINRIVNEAINLAQSEPKGPVHINAPFREPLYPDTEETFAFSKVRVVDDKKGSSQLSDASVIELLKEWSGNKKILVVAGQHTNDEKLSRSIREFSSHHDVPVVGDVLSNLHGIEEVLRHAELFLGAAPEKVKESLRPDLLITFGQSVISKNLKLFLRNSGVKNHWHIQEAGVVADTYQNISRVIRTSPVTFFGLMASIDKPKGFESQQQSNYHKLWGVEERRASRALSEGAADEASSELELVRTVFDGLPTACDLHLANSMSVRYANLATLSRQSKDVSVHSNRGTSGIDGCTSTAVGYSLVSERPQFLVTGDMAFFYDRNAFWHNYKLPNLRIVLLNNHGGVIFKMIDGPASLPEGDEFFVTHQKLKAENLCKEYDIDYLTIKNHRQVKNILKDFFEFDGRAKILEFESSIEINQKTIDQLKTKIRESYEL